MGNETTKSSDLLAAAVTAPGACVNHCKNSVARSKRGKKTRRQEGAGSNLPTTVSKFMLDALPFMTCGIHRGKVVSEDCRSECALGVRLAGWIGDEDDEQQQKGKFSSLGRKGQNEREKDQLVRSSGTRMSATATGRRLTILAVKSARR
ncbi:hypothetical protein R1flu_028575 [Riccia fluitans]|uniref:Uncharacterized protein n=1 Tax=Riccia fluitans TaxID=41844 RepID=A0ABD1XM51_9MARC